MNRKKKDSFEGLNVVCYTSIGK